MSHVAPAIPDESVLLCEGCGYILSGLPSESRCPECGKAIAESLPEVRQRPEWEKTDSDRPAWRRFGRTTMAVIFRSSWFYRTLATRSLGSGSRQFARIHLLITSILMGLAGTLQLQWLLDLPGLHNWVPHRFDLMQTDVLAPLAIGLVGLLVCGAVCYGTLAGLTAIAARLTAWEAAFRGYRLPYTVVLRGLDYHSPHYLPVAAGAFLTVAGYQLLLMLGVLDGLSAPQYLYVLCVEVVVSAGYLFWTYWVAMRNMLFANG
ncbi:MAG: hypothetical protein ACM359_24820 [Bacillota bacterium]